ncbi:hypothetical protein [uncultured Methanobrevibacter sp.]|uniref:T4 family baseplate hub assembly chaperone n=1 Tax=uncultured Methanobrevibacter sp. TaxID=253161 RepID=UPI0025F7B75F|nr:hypothetical protein [uncultured Methanobrevibacter sp.]
MNNEYTQYQEDVNTAFDAAMENNEQSKTSGLGHVDVTRNRNHQLDENDPEFIKMKQFAGFIDLPLENLPSAGRFYRDDIKIRIRPALVKEIRNFSMIDENNIQDIDEKLNDILISCSKVTFGDSLGSYKDLLEEDRLYVILSIRELSFKDGENKIMMPVSKKCECGGCADAYELKTSNIQCYTPDESIEKYYDPTIKGYRILTKNYGEIIMAPPTIGVMRAITDWARKKEEENKQWDKSLFQIVPYLVREWRGFDERSIMGFATNIAGWDATKFSIVFKMAEKIKVGVKPEFTYVCNKCGGEVTVPLSFQGGVRSLFVISDISSELL